MAPTRFRDLNSRLKIMVQISPRLEKCRQDPDQSAINNFELHHEFITAAYKITSIITELLDIFESDSSVWQAAEYINSIEFLVCWCSKLTGATRGESHFLDNLKRACIISVFEQLFGTYPTVSGLEKISQVPIRITNINKAGIFLLQEKQKCTLKKMQKELMVTEDPQFIAAAQIVRTKTTGWGEDAMKTIKLVALKIQESQNEPVLDPAVEQKSSSDTDFDSSLDSDIENRALDDPEGLNASINSYAENSIDTELTMYKKFTKVEWKSCK